MNFDLNFYYKKVSPLLLIISALTFSQCPRISEGATRRANRNTENNAAAQTAAAEIASGENMTAEDERRSCSSYETQRACAI